MMSYLSYKRITDRFDFVKTLSPEYVSGYIVDVLFSEQYMCDLILVMQQIDDYTLCITMLEILNKNKKVIGVIQVEKLKRDFIKYVHDYKIIRI